MKKDHTGVEACKHGDKVTLTVNGKDFPGIIEERMIGQWPSENSEMFVRIMEEDGTPAPYSPIPMDEFLNNWGIINR